MILGTMSVLAIALFWILPALVLYSIIRSWLSEKPSLFSLLVKVWLVLVAYKWFILFVLDKVPTPIKELLMMFSVLPLAPESIFVRYFVNIRTTSHHEWIVTCAVLSFISSGLIGASVAGAKLYVIRRRKMGAR